jgi:hypothetical protein
MDKTVGEMLEMLGSLNTLHQREEEEEEEEISQGRKEGRKKFILPVCRKERFRVELFSLNHRSQAPVPLLDL